MDLIKISIVIAIIGIAALYFITNYFKENTTKIVDLKTGQVSRISGMVTSLRTSKDGHVFLKVADNTGEINVVAFKGSNLGADGLEVGDSVSVLGRVEEYKGALEIIAKEMRSG